MIKTFAAVAVAASAAAQAATITEPPDLSDFLFSGTDVGSFGAGTHIIAGTLDGFCEENPNADFADCSGGDNADIVLPNIAPGLVVTAASITVSDLVFDGNLGDLGIVYAYGPGGATLLDFTTGGVTLTGTTSILPFDFAVVPATGIGVAVLSATISAPFEEQGTGNFSLGYRLSFTLAPDRVIPVPGAVVLFGSVLAAAGVTRRFRAAS